MNANTLQAYWNTRYNMKVTVYEMMATQPYSANTTHSHASSSSNWHVYDASKLCPPMGPHRRDLPKERPTTDLCRFWVLLGDNSQGHIDFKHFLSKHICNLQIIAGVDYVMHVPPAEGGEEIEGYSDHTDSSFYETTQKWEEAEERAQFIRLPRPVLLHFYSSRVFKVQNV